MFYQLGRSLLLCWIMLMMISCVHAQQNAKITGQVTNINKVGLRGVKIFLDNTYDETETDSSGHFILNTTGNGPQVLIAHLEGYNDVRKDVIIDRPEILLNIIIDEKINNLSVVTVRNNKNAIEKADADSRLLSPIALLTTVTDGDIFSGLRLMPGAQQVGESGELFVRGGAGSETRLYIDGMLVNNYLRASAPNQSSTSRYPPGMFNGFYFNAGGYSALYGQGLSSVLSMETTDLPFRSSGNISISPIFVGGDAQLLSKNGKSALSLAVNYQNFTLYNKLIKSDLPGQEFEDPPTGLEMFGRYLQKLPHNGLLKVFTNWSSNSLVYRQSLLEKAGKFITLDIYNPNINNIIQYQQPIRKWKVEASVSWSRNVDHVNIDTLDGGDAQIGPRQQVISYLLQARNVWKRDLSRKVTVAVGAEWQWYKDIYTSNNLTREMNDHYTAAFAETQWYGGSRWYATVGVRGEYSSLLSNASLSPRVNLHITSSDNGQFILAFGHFYQKPKNDYLLQKNSLEFEKAVHYITSYLHKWGSKNLRAELYYKKYTSLVSLVGGEENNGYGYASGLDLFWRDKESIGNVEYWVSYSFLKAKRKYLDYPIEAIPTFAPAHTASLVLKKFISKPSVIISTSYTYSSGRTYYNPNQPANKFLTDKTIDYHKLNLNLSYLTKIRGAFSVIVVTVSNVLGNKQVFGYTYSTSDPSLRREVKPMYKRFIFAGLFINFGIDRRDQVINSQL